jgi:hypothetical protein
VSESPTNQTPVDTDAPAGDLAHLADSADSADAVVSSVEPTGHPAVDEVLASLQGLEQRPSTEHVQVFESAHDRLRAALADAGSASPDA